MKVLLPSDYYVSHFDEFISKVSRSYQPLFTEACQALVDDYRLLPLDAKRLWLRMLSRKGEIFDLDSLQYPEIVDFNGALAAVLHQDFARWPADDRDVMLWLTKATKPQLWQCLNLSTTAALKKSADRDTLLSKVLAAPPSAEQLQTLVPSLICLRTAPVSFLLFLYFGRLEANLSAFVQRDIGVTALANYKTDYQARFLDLDTASAAYAQAQFDHDWQLATPKSTLLNLEQCQQWRARLQALPEVKDSKSEEKRQKAYYQLGLMAERIPELAFAEQCFIDADGFPASERLLKMYLRQQKTIDKQASRQSQTETDLTEAAEPRAKRRTKSQTRMQAKAKAQTQHPSEAKALSQKIEQLLTRMVTDPDNEQEYYLALDIQAKLGNQQVFASTRHVAEHAITLLVDESYRQHPEQAALQYFKQHGWQGAHVENQVWTALFALLCWQPLFCDQHSAIHSEFDRYPSNLNDGRWYAEHHQQINDCIAQLLDPKRCLQQVLQTLTENYGKANALVQWHEDLAQWLTVLIQGVPATSLMPLMVNMAEHFRDYRTGFPDLLLWRGSEHCGIRSDSPNNEQSSPCVESTEPAAGYQLRWLEVKAPGDSLRRNQFARIKRLQQLGFAVEIAKLQWGVNPQQRYHVVDIETTGGRANVDRIIEIAIVTVQNQKIIGQYSSLIDPARTIPSFISKLTHISNAMVQGQPSFADLAPTIYGLLSDGIFVAHNVKFDFSFVQAEFARIGIDFDAAKLCTVIETRRHFPGLASYSLAALTEHFAIELKQHHRALADAQAAAQLLLLALSKRRQQQATLHAQDLHSTKQE